MDIFLRLWKTEGNGVDLCHLGAHNRGQITSYDCPIFSWMMELYSLGCSFNCASSMLSSHGMLYIIRGVFTVSYIHIYLDTYILRVQNGVLLDHHISCCLTKKLEETLAIMRHLGFAGVIQAANHLLN